jgi:hypothetical protein
MSRSGGSQRDSVLWGVVWSPVVTVAIIVAVRLVFSFDLIGPLDATSDWSVDHVNALVKAVSQ